MGREGHQEEVYDGPRASQFPVTWRSVLGGLIVQLGEVLSVLIQLFLVAQFYHFVFMLFIPALLGFSVTGLLLVSVSRLSL